MTGLVLVTHAGLAGALKSAAEMIVGGIDLCASVEVAPVSTPMKSWPVSFPRLKRSVQMAQLS